MLPVPGDNVFPRENIIVLRVFAAFGFTYVRSAGYCEYIFALFRYSALRILLYSQSFGL